MNAISLFLRNRQPERWRDRIEVSHDISDRVADRLDAARLRMIERLQAPVIEAAAVVETVARPRESAREPHKR
jgi:hypothetical protein